MLMKTLRFKFMKISMSTLVEIYKPMVLWANAKHTIAHNLTWQATIILIWPDVRNQGRGQKLGARRQESIGG